MKTILVDAVNCFVSESGEIFKEMHNLLEGFPNKKIILTGANDEQVKKFKLDKMPYPVFTLGHNPEKTNSEYFRILLKHFNLDKKDVIYFEHSPGAVKSAESVGIVTYHYDKEKRDLVALKNFLLKNLQDKMTEVKVLIEGYAKESDEGMLASCSTVLIKDSGKNILVDPGCNPGLLMENLKKQGLEPKDINSIFLTHYHPDHILNMRLFPNIDVLDGGVIYRNDLEMEFEDKIPETNIKFIDTPGHAHEQASLIVETEQGKIGIASDLFWWMDKDEQKTDYESLINLKDPFVKNEQDLKESRKKVLEIADWIIPGHGKMFKVEK